MDPFKNMPDTPSLPARAPFQIVPSDAEPQPALCKGIYVGRAGDVVLRGVDAQADVTYRNLPDASYIAVRARFVRASGTTAADLIGEA